MVATASLTWLFHDIPLLKTAAFLDRLNRKMLNRGKGLQRIPKKTLPWRLVD
jgi:hypothetical protein